MKKEEETAFICTLLPNHTTYKKSSKKNKPKLDRFTTRSCNKRTHMIGFVFREFYKFWVVLFVVCCMFLFCRILQILGRLFVCCLLHVFCFVEFEKYKNGCTWSSKRSWSFWWIGERLKNTHTHTHTHHILYSGVVGKRALLVQRIYMIIYWLSSCIGFSCSVEHVKKKWFFFDI